MMGSRLRLLAVAGLAACAGDGTGAGEVLVVAEIGITPPGAGLVVGGTQQLTASPRTSSGIPVPGRTVTWYTSHDGIATVSASGLVTAVALGEATITARVDQITAGVLVNVSPKPVATVTVDPPAAGLQVGQSLTIEATALDGEGEPLAGRTISFLSDNPSIASVSTTGVVTAIAPGATVIRARAEGKEGISTITVTARPATRLGFTTQPGNAAAGQPLAAVRVAVQDEIGGTVTTATNSVTLELADNPENVTLGGTLTVAAVAGIATFNNLSLTRTGTGYTLRATSGSLSPALSSPFAITSGPGAALGVAVQPSVSAQSGLPLAQAPVVQVQDAHGNPVAQPGVTVSVGLAGSSGTLSGPVTATTGANGAATFPGLVIAGGPGTYQLRFTASNLTAVVSDGIVLASSALAMVTQPSASATNGAPLAQQPVVRITELDGTPLPQAGLPVTVTLTGNGATLSGATTVNTNGSGVVSFTGLTLTGTAGSFTLSFAAPGIAPITSAPITLGPGAATQIRIAVQPPAGAGSGAALSPAPEIQVADQSGNPVSASGIAVTASIASGTGGTLGGSQTVSTNAGGRAIFSNLSIAGPSGSFTLRFNTAALGSVVSNPVTLGAGSATQLSITTQPSPTAQNGAPLAQQPVIHLEDQSGNAVSQAGVLVTATLASGSGSLTGETATTNGSGVAMFSGLTISGAAGAKTLGFSAPGLSGTTSSTITLSAGAATQIAANSIQSQSATVSTAVGSPPSVVVTDGGGNPVGGVDVTFAVTAGGGSIEPSAAVIATNASGVATLTSWTLGGSAGSINNTVTATAAGLSGSPVSFTATATAGAAATITANSDQSQSAPVVSAVDDAPSVLVTDSEGNPVSGVPVTFTVTAGGGSTSPASPATVNSNASGIASLASWTLGPAIGSDNNTVTATAAGLSGSPVTFTASGTIGAAANIEAASDVSQSAEVGTAVAEAPAVRVTDGGGNPVSGVSVTFTGSGGSIDPAAPAVIPTGADGIASLTSWTLGTTAGSNSVTASAAGLGDVDFEASGTPGAAASLTITQQPSSTATNDVVLAQQPTVQVKDAHGNAKPGVTVTVSLGGDGNLDGDDLTGVSDAGGFAAFSGLKITGPTGTKTLIFSADGVSDAVSNGIDFTGTDASLMLLSGMDATDFRATLSPDGAPFQPIPEAETPVGLQAALVSDSVATPDISGRFHSAKPASQKHLTGSAGVP